MKNVSYTLRDHLMELTKQGPYGFDRASDAIWRTLLYSIRWGMYSPLSRTISVKSTDYRYKVCSN